MSQVAIDADSYLAGLQTKLAAGSVLVTDSDQAPWGQVLMTGRHALPADEPVAAGGQDSGPAPHDLILMALGACTAITVRMYAARKGWPIDRILVRLNYPQTEGINPPKPDYYRIVRNIELIGSLDDEQRARLLAIAEKCPVHRQLSHGVLIHSELVPAS